MKVQLPLHAGYDEEHYSYQCQCSQDDKCWRTKGQVLWRTTSHHHYSSQSDKLISLGDFNTCIGTDHQAWDRLIGKHRVGKCNSNGLFLLKTCATDDLPITNTMFWLPNCNKTSLMHPCSSKHWYFINYVIIRAKASTGTSSTTSSSG